MNAKVSLPLLVSSTGDNVITIGVDGLSALHGAEPATTIARDKRDPEVPFEQEPIGPMFDGEPRGMAGPSPHPCRREGTVLVVESD